MSGVQIRCGNGSGGRGSRGGEELRMRWSELSGVRMLCRMLRRVSFIRDAVETMKVLFSFLKSG